MSTPNPAAPATPAAPTRHVITHLLTPLLMCIGMGLAYMSAFLAPAPHHVPVAVIGDSPRIHALTTRLQTEFGDKLTLTTVPDRPTATAGLQNRTYVAAFTPDPAAPALAVASAGSDSSATVAEKAFTMVAAAEGKPLAVTDVVAPVADDPTSSGAFFLMVAISIGSYGAVAAIGAAAQGWTIRRKALLGAGVATAVAAVGTSLAGPVFHIAHHGLAAVYGMAWLYAAGIILIGVGLHTFLKKWTTLVMMVLFVMLNFTSSGGLFQPELQNGFFGALHGFWNGAGLVEGLRGMLYFDGSGVARHVWTLIGWLAVGAVVATTAALAERARTPLAARPESAEDAAEEFAEAVAA